MTERKKWNGKSQTDLDLDHPVVPWSKLARWASERWMGGQAVLQLFRARPFLSGSGAAGAVVGAGAGGSGGGIGQIDIDLPRGKSGDGEQRNEGTNERPE